MVMKSWFPFSDYDFYGYLVSGFALLFTLDFAFNGGAIMLRSEWAFVQIVLVTGIAYFCGQMLATPSSIVLEHFLVRTILKSPLQVLLSVNKPDIVTLFIGRVLVGRYYEPLPISQRGKIFSKAAIDNNVSVEEIEQNLELVFMPAYSTARKDSDVRQRIDDFRNQYGLNRNMAFTALLVAFVFTWQWYNTEGLQYGTWSVLTYILAIGMLVRFLKFYAAFTAEVLRAYGYAEKGKAD